jgi:hypothetical protein
VRDNQMVRGVAFPHGLDPMRTLHRAQSSVKYLKCRRLI